MARQSVMEHSFSRVPRVEMPRSSFDRSHGYKTTLDAGYLVPIFADEALPGDSFTVNMAGFARLATPIHPIMDNMRMETFFFAVPKRILWDNFVKMNGEQRNPGDSIDYIVPQMVAPAGGYLEESLSDYLGIPTKVAGLSHSALFHRAYNLIYREWFRDQNLQNSPVVDLDDGPDDPADYKLLRRGKRHDYFTACLPAPQKGEAVDLPLGTTADILSLAPSGQNVTVKNAGIGSGDYYLNAATTNVSQTGTDQGDETQKLVADLSNATAATINSLRQAFQIQRMLEKDARGGTRYTEVVRSHFGVISPDARLQRPEYLGGGSTPVQINPVPQTSESGTSAQGNLAGFGTVSINGHGFSKSFTEHCVIIGLLNVRADLTYQQGLNRMFSRSTRYDFYWPSLSHIGEQAVLRKEIYATGVKEEDDTVFGYQERFGEYRYKPSLITGQFRSNAATPLDVWHLSQEFSVAPVLNETFIQDDPPVDRVIAVQTEPHFLFDAYFKMRCARPMPLFGVPGMIDHF